ncbi:MAG: hypothetical protein HPY83_13190, partial [Anaerolineae bacterium]|nr:hypothetical protein [Anaerolineae bacterium]
SGCVRLPEAYDNPYLLVRNLAFQQFYLHHRSPYSFAMGRLGRNQLLFGSLPSAHPFQADFARITGLTISQFLELSMTLVCRFLVEGERSLTVDWLEPAQRNYPPGTTQRFLDALSRDRSSVTEWLRSAAGSHSLACELYEESPLQRYPLLREGNVYHCYSSLLLMHSISFFVYRMLRDSDPQVFMRLFGPLFEQHVRRGVDYLGLPYDDERELISKLGRGCKVVDFVISDGSHRVFVDAKGVEMTYLGQTSHDPSIVSNKAKDSFLKGLCQAYSTARALNQRGEASTGDNYLLIVTFRELFLSNGQAFRDYVDAEAVDRIVRKFGGAEWVPLRNVFCCSVDDWDRFVQCCARKRYLGPAQLLREYVRADARSARKMKFVFGYHVEESHPSPDEPRYLRSAAETVWKRVRNWFPNTSH